MNVIKTRFQVLEGLQYVRDTSPVSSRNTSKGALIGETYAVFSAIREGLSLNDVRQAILDAKIFYKSSFETRRKIKDAIHHRYLSVYPEWLGSALSTATEKGIHSPEYLSLAYLYFALRDKLVFDFITNDVWSKWKSHATYLNRTDFLYFLDQQAQASPQIKRWRESTRKRLASSNLAALRDFGILKGTQKKYIQRPAIAPEAVFHLVCILMAEGREGQAILEAPDWRLFLWSEADVAIALGHLSQKKWIRFEKAGKTVILQLIRIPEIKS